LYLGPKEIGLLSLVKLFRGLSFDTLYLNSFFSLLCIKIFLLRQVGLIRATRLIFAPRGEFFPGALSIHSGRKSVYLQLVKSFRLIRHLTWQATSEAENQAILSLHDNHGAVQIAPEIIVPPALRRIMSECIPRNSRDEKQSGTVKLV